MTDISLTVFLGLYGSSVCVEQGAGARHARKLGQTVGNIVDALAVPTMHGWRERFIRKASTIAALDFARCYHIQVVNLIVIQHALAVWAGIDCHFHIGTCDCGQLTGCHLQGPTRINDGFTRNALRQDTAFVAMASAGSEGIHRRCERGLAARASDLDRGHFVFLLAGS